MFEKLDKNKKYILIKDNVGFHKTSCIKNFIAQYSNIVIEPILSYSPELNLIENCWKVTKNAVTKSQYFPTIDKMQEALETFWSEHIFTQEFIGYLCR